MEMRRFGRVALAGAVLMGAVMAGISLLVEGLPASTFLFAGINLGVILAGAGASLRTPGGGAGFADWRLSTAASAVIVGSTLLGTLALHDLAPDLLLAVRFLVLTTGAAGFFLGLVAGTRGRSRAVPNTDASARSG